MNKGYYLTAFIAWLIASLILVCTVIGMLLFCRTDGNTLNWQGDRGRSTWMTIGIKLIEKLIK